MAWSMMATIVVVIILDDRWRETDGSGAGASDARRNIGVALNASRAV